MFHPLVHYWMIPCSTHWFIIEWPHVPPTGPLLKNPMPHPLVHYWRTPCSTHWVIIEWRTLCSTYWVIIEEPHVPPTVSLLKDHVFHPLGHHWRALCSTHWFIIEKPHVPPTGSLVQYWRTHRLNTERSCAPPTGLFLKDPMFHTQFQYWPHQFYTRCSITDESYVPPTGSFLKDTMFHPLIHWKLFNGPHVPLTLVHYIYNYWYIVNLFYFASDLFSLYSQGRNFHENKSLQKFYSIIKANETYNNIAKLYRHEMKFHQQNMKINSCENKKLYSTPCSTNRFIIEGPHVPPTGSLLKDPMFHSLVNYWRSPLVPTTVSV